MEYVQAHLPEWMWGSINKCRLYLQAVVFSDLTDIHGQTIATAIYQVVGCYRKSRLSFPTQIIEPADTDINNWQYFIRHITKDGKSLNTPLGRWEKNPYQHYPYAMDLQTKLVYKQAGDQSWEVFHPTTGTRNTYEPSQLQRSRLPKQWTPVRVIERSYRKIGVIDCENVNMRQTAQTPQLGVFLTKEERKVVGQFEIDKQEIQNLKQKWHSEMVTLLCGTDGGLKDGIGTTGYMICWRYG